MLVTSPLLYDSIVFLIPSISLRSVVIVDSTVFLKTTLDYVLENNFRIGQYRKGRLMIDDGLEVMFKCKHGMKGNQ